MTRETGRGRRENKMAEERKWVAGWGAAVSVLSQNYAEYVKDHTFRYVIFPTVPADGIRLHFSNEYGTEPVCVAKVYAAKRLAGDAVDTGTSVRVTFGGKSELLMDAGGTAVSDGVPFEVRPGEEFCISMYIGETTQVRTGYSCANYRYVSKYHGAGDWADAGAIPLEEYGEDTPYLFLNTVDFLAPAGSRAVIAFGDSITSRPWPDCLSRRIYEAGMRDVSVVRKAIGGNRILREYRYRIKKHWGVAGIRRFERDVCQAGADRVIVLEGINDLIHPGEGNRLCPMSELPGAEELIERGYREYIRIARAHGMKIYLCTLIPCPRCLEGGGEREETRLAVNEWMRNYSECDGVIDFDAAVRSPGDPHRMTEEYDSGDHIHPSFAGSSRLAGAVPLEYLTD